ncbi:GNAT family N-acetyltransferase [Robertmurraya korlensis]|uniref:GNAT family N-acetyltransferase n=1 Tax=Robertmurraya korlensis TaxID=519977 RepID=UPI000824DCCD|nr:GNAT family protein [Robertmurraya korlensis]
MIQGEFIHIRPLVLDDVEECLDFQVRNQNFFEAFAMERPSDFYTITGQHNLIKRKMIAAEDDTDYYFGIFLQSTGALIGTMQLFQVLRGSLQSAYIGYFLDKEHNGKGYTTEAAKLLVSFGFENLKLHRIEAGVMPHNIASIRVLQKAGFEKEGIARKNVRINGKWEDHQVLAIINPLD